jgi:hypothetical protein
MATFFINSETAQQRSALGSRVEFTLATPVDISNKKCRVLMSNIWYTIPNVTAALGNNTVKFSYNSVNHVITLYDGIYSIIDFNESIAEGIRLAGILSLTMTLIPDEATGLITLEIKRTSPFQIDFSLAENGLFRNMLGFVGTFYTTVDAIYESTNKARLNTTNTLYIHCSFATGSYYNEIAGSDIIAAVPLRVAPGSLITTQDNNPVICQCVGSMLNRYTITITNENNILVDMGGEFFNLILEIF